ncbi:hypothetical protein [Thermodesulforhabdus norvegica]|uniref:Uncharacterized protein n=1 Tax=Thermodesulforhabdus norvegica TaxID=39841 RepID=A0A1I4TEE8_9BACT|nr:hypothetical protein [Thermodesulforhabdus norvegica]SFM74973.1 hypothetical protein SAMN05660836_01367 [Thermodesulforhabdus norvegica]
MKSSSVRNRPISFDDFAINGYPGSVKSEKSFGKELDSLKARVSRASQSQNRPFYEVGLHSTAGPDKPATTTAKALEAYSKSMSLGEQIRVYAKEQLLSNPGGDFYDENSPDGLYKGDHDSFASRLRKDFSDALANVRNFFLDLTVGSSFRYVNAEGKIEEARKPGLLSSIGNFFKHLVSGITFGAYVPEGESRPSGFANRIGHFFKSLYRAIVGDGVTGVVKSLNHATEDLTLAAWNALEMVPDATLGNTSSGRKVVTAFFDTGQVILDYVTDVAPGGEAWSRVHSGNIFKGEMPFVTNIRQPTNSQVPPWQTVRNTPFRKAVETLGTLAVDILGFFSLKRWLMNSGDSGDHR